MLRPRRKLMRPRRSKRRKVKPLRRLLMKPKPTRLRSLRKKVRKNLRKEPKRLLRRRPPHLQQELFMTPPDTLSQTRSKHLTLRSLRYQPLSHFEEYHN